MTKHEAHTLLNAVQAGFPASQATITEALMVTGDLDGKTAVKADSLVFHTSATVDRWGHVETRTEVLS